MAKSTTKTTFVVFLGPAGSESDLEPMKLYRVLEAQPGDPKDYMRVVDESGEDYLYPTKHFAIISLPQKVKTILQAAS